MRLKTTAALAVSLAIVNSGGQSAPAKAPPRRILSVATQEVPKDCGPPHSPLPTESWTITLHVPKKWDPINPGRHTHNSKKGQPGNEEEGPGEDPILGPPGEKNPFHIDVTKLPGASSTNPQYAKVKIILKDPKAHFGSWKIGGTDIHSVGTTGNQDNMLCGLQDPVRKNNRDSVIFFIVVNPDISGRTPIDRPFTFAIFGDDAPETPILIDPSVKNYG